MNSDLKKRMLIQLTTARGSVTLVSKALVNRLNFVCSILSSGRFHDAFKKSTDSYRSLLPGSLLSNDSAGTGRLGRVDDPLTRRQPDGCRSCLVAQRKGFEVWHERRGG